MNHNKKRRQKHFDFGKRKFNIIHTKLRNNCSTLNMHLHHFNLTPYPRFVCGAYVKDNYHYLLTCPIYAVQRVRMLQRKSNVYSNPDLPVFLFGLLILHCKRYIGYVQDFMSEAKRFTD